MALVDTFASVLPSDSLPLLFEILQEIEGLPGLRDWHPPEPTFMALVDVVSLGFPLHFVGNVSENRAIREKVARSIIDQKPLSAPEIAELHGCAIFTALGSVESKYIKCKKDVRTPDIEVIWDSGIISDVEIVSGQAKRDHIERRNLIKSVVDKIDIQGKQFDIVIHCSAMMPESSAMQILEIANSINQNEMVEETGLWQVRGQAISGRGPDVIRVKGYRDNVPDWWGKDMLSSIHFGSVLGVQDEKTPRPQIRAVTGLRISSYLNPVVRKASRSQERENVFIIAFDVSHLPGAFRELEQGLDGYFPQWDHVAGVMAFEPFVLSSLSRIGWRRRFFANKYCTQRLPDELIALERHDEGVMDVFCFLRKTDEDGYHSITVTLQPQQKWSTRLRL